MSSETMSSEASTGPARPAGVNHLVLNVRDIEASHRFYTEILGFEAVVEVAMDSPMRFYRSGPGHHHDIALAQVKRPEEQPEFYPQWRPSASRAGVNHIAIAYPDREAFLHQLRHLQANDVAISMRGNHGMTHSAYITDPDGNGIEVLYELPADVWEGDLPKAMLYFESLPNQGPEMLEDRTDVPTFQAQR
jgi:catechol 2,3-dioxygenase